ncbi:hypothetical protein NL676_005762 [Syzygium grande]|nr:hypothetical protein NL676_005762 [Syzygium grande]
MDIHTFVIKKLTQNVSFSTFNKYEALGISRFLLSVFGSIRSFVSDTNRRAEVGGSICPNIPQITKSLLKPFAFYIASFMPRYILLSREHRQC